MSPGDDGECEVEQGEVVAGLLGPGLLATRAQVQGEAELRGQGARLVVVEPLVEAEVLGSLPRWSGPLDWNGLECRPHQLVVIAVGPVDGRPEGHAAAV